MNRLPSAPVVAIVPPVVGMRCVTARLVSWTAWTTVPSPMAFVSAMLARFVTGLK